MRLTIESAQAASLNTRRLGACVIGRNEDMFIPKGQSAGGVAWNDTLFWNVYYVKGAFLNADAA